MFRATPLKSTDHRLARAQFLTLKGTRAWPFPPRTNHFPASPWESPFFPVPVGEFLHQFMTILAIKIGRWRGPLPAVFSSGRFSHGTLVCSSAQKRHWNDLQHYAVMS